MKTFLRLLLRLLFRFRAENTGALDTPGPVMLLPNHISWFDWLLVAVCVDTSWRFVTSKEAAQTSWVHRFIMINRFTFPVEVDSPFAVKRIAEYLQGGGKLVLFPEGRLSRTGSLMKLFDGTGFLLFKTNAKIITCYLRGAQGLPFSPNPNRKSLFPTVSAHFSDIVTAPKMEGMSTMRARQKLTRWLYDVMVRQQFEIELAASPQTILGLIIETARRFPEATVLQDVTRKKLTLRRLLAGAAALAEQWRKELTSDSGERIGVLLPNSNAVPATLLSLWSVSKVPAIFNFSTGIPTMLVCAQMAEVKTIVTSRTFLERARLNLQPMADAGIRIVHLEDVRARISRPQQWRALGRATFAPESLVGAQQRDSTAVILFTSGSEGTPKGVELTHTNVISNILQMLAVLDVMDCDRMFNALPLFHSFGLLALLLGLSRGIFVFLYPSPLHYRIIPSLLYELDCTIFFGTNTFLNGYSAQSPRIRFSQRAIAHSRRGKIAGSHRQHLGAAIGRARARRIRRDRVQSRHHGKYAPRASFWVCRQISAGNRASVGAG